MPGVLSGETFEGATGPIHAASNTGHGFLLSELAVGIGAGFFEELGWTCVALRRMLTRHGFWRRVSASVMRYHGARHEDVRSVPCRSLAGRLLE